MQKQKMTIHRALAELKLIDSRILKGIQELKPVGVYQKDKNVNGIFPIKDFEDDAKSKYDSVTALIDRKLLIKSAIVKTNAETIVTISGKEMSIADAITFKTVIELKKEFVNMLQAQLNTVHGNMNKSNEKVQENVQLILTASFGKDNVKVSKEDIDSITKPYLAANEYHLADLLKLQDKIDALNKEIENFETEIDAVLSEINAITIIEI